jgi:hypothetical protein
LLSCRQLVGGNEKFWGGNPRFRLSKIGSWWAIN